MLSTKFVLDTSGYNVVDFLSRDEFLRKEKGTYGNEQVRA